MPTTIKQPKHIPSRKALEPKTKRQVSSVEASDVALLPSTGNAAAVESAPGVMSSAQKAKAHKLLAQIAKLEEELKALHVVMTPKVTLQELHDGQSGRIDAQKVAEFMGVALKPLSEGLGLNYKAVHRNPSAANFQEALRPVKRALELLDEFFGSPETIRTWLNTPHPDLSGATALETILEGQADAMTLILENAWNGVPV